MAVNTMQQNQPQYVAPAPGLQPIMGGGPAATYFKETASQTYGVGDLIYLDANGTIAICTVSSHQLNSAILGQADAPASGTTGAQVNFHAIRSDDVYIMNAFHTTKASAVFAQTDLGATFNVYLDPTSATWTVDKVDAVVSTLPRVKVVGFPTAGLNSSGQWVTNAAPGDIYGLAYVQFLPFWNDSSSKYNVVALQLD